ncbi:DUF2460 domain-containing protein [Fodinicurvata halophila]|uniref:DUF2460 domain-containing protein n=2 Tax=Fodinicurvata halophila TaxID=1419723 RepID=A0ABV8UPV9_9PROT
MPEHSIEGFDPGGFDDVAFPLALARGSEGGPEFSTAIVETASGREQRNQNRAAARLRFNAARGLRSAADRDLLMDFFYARRGRARAFPLRDWADYKSCPTTQAVSPTDQLLGHGDGVRRRFALVKRYGAGAASYQRRITLPQVDSLRVALDGVEVDGAEVTAGWSVDRLAGELVFDSAPAAGVELRAGFIFDVPVRFDSDRLEVSWLAPGGHEVAEVPLVEVILS